MSGTYQTVNQDAPGGLNDTAAQVRDGVASAAAANAAAQQDAARFIVENGHDVVSGHADVNHPRG